MLERALTLDEFARLPIPEALRRYEVGVENFDRRVFELTEAQLDHAFLPGASGAEQLGRWPVRVLLGHLADAEVVFAARVRRVVGESGPVFELFDENAYIDSGLYAGEEPAPASAGPTPAMLVRGPQPIGAFVAVIHTLRRWTGQWLGTLDERAWTRQGMHPQRGPLTLRDLVAIDGSHLEHHAVYLNRKVARLLGSPGA